MTLAHGDAHREGHSGLVCVEVRVQRHNPEDLWIHQGELSMLLHAMSASQVQNNSRQAQRHIEVNVTTETRVPGRKSAWLRFQTHTHSIVTVVALHSILLARHTCSREEMLPSVKTSLHNTFRSRTDRLLVEWDSFLSS